MQVKGLEKTPELNWSIESGNCLTTQSFSATGDNLTPDGLETVLEKRSKMGTGKAEKSPLHIWMVERRDVDFDFEKWWHHRRTSCSLSP